jgi:hypothetical protein
METQYNITSVDAANIVRLIDAVTKRGAFDGSELSAVGVIRDKFFAMVKDHNDKIAPTTGVKE